MHVRTVALTLLLSLPGASVLAAPCDSAQELMASARSRMQAGGADPAQLKEALQLLSQAVALCPGLADAYYYLSVIGAELKDPRTTSWRLRAQMLDSEALRSSKGGPPSVSAGAAVEQRISPIVRQKLALVVGVSRFKDSRINSLRYTAGDAKAVAETLERVSKFDYVKLLLDEQATNYNFKTEINRLAGMADPTDLVVIYVSSHGSPENLDAAGVNYIVTYDTEVSNLYPTAYKMDDLLDDIGVRIKAERVVAFLDTCYSGGTFRQLPTGWAATSRSLAADFGPSSQLLQDRLKRGAKALMVETPTEQRKDRMPQGVGRVVITSSSQSERSWEDERIQHGYFTYYLLDALLSRTPLSLEDLFAQLKTKVPEAVRRDKNESQHPSIARSRDRVEIYLRDEIVGAP